MREEVLTMIRELEAELKALKKTYRDPTRQPPGPSTYQGIFLGKRKATLLYCAIAQSRGRIHCKGWTLEQQEKFVEERLSPILKAAMAA
jgi:hypothetical protein